MLKKIGKILSMNLSTSLNISVDTKNLDEVKKYQDELVSEAENAELDVDGILSGFIKNVNGLMKTGKTVSSLTAPKDIINLKKSMNK